MIIRRARVEDAAGIARVHVNSWQTTYRGIVPDDYLDAIQLEEWRERWVDNLSTPAPNTFGHVAENEENGEVAGFVRGGTTRNPELPYRGELYAIYTLKEYQLHGLGRHLVQSMARDLQNADMTEMLLWVFETNLASHRFYETLGGCYVKSNTFEINGVPIVERAYAWTDLNPLLQDGRI